LTTVETVSAPWAVHRRSAVLKMLVELLADRLRPTSARVPASGDIDLAHRAG